MSNNISRRWTQSLPVSTLSPSSPFSLSCPETHQQQTKCSGARGGDSRSVTVVSFITCIHLAKEKRMEKRRFFRSGFDMHDFQIFVWTSWKSSGLPGSRLDFLEVVWTSWKSSDEVFNHMVLIFLSFKDVEDFWARRLPDDFHEVFQTTSRKSSDGVFNQMVLIFHLDISRKLPGRLPDDFQEVFQTTSKKSSRRLPGSLLTGSSSISSGV
ncbi:hypothetical protein F2Q68_00019216 [Brassica cretica]|uniref:Uncharacterized protein n=1 Tax=Brassica cretica TaxID=69181 RepID=A0A8S9FWV6_BRACR|nr:hypothetical protein F2Q68_00019216 [Brassica cretica]